MGDFFIPGIKEASAMLSKSAALTPGANLLAYQDVNLGIPPGFLVALWGVDLIVPEMDVDVENGGCGYTVNPNASDTNVQTGARENDNMIFWYEAALVITVEGATNSRPTKQVMLPRPILTTRDVRFAAFLSTGATGTAVGRLYYQYMEATDSALVSLFGLSIQRN